MRVGLKKPKKISIITLGCDKNTVDSEIIMAQLGHSDYELTDNPDEADTVLINTCGFIEAAKQQSLDSIMSAVQMKKEGRLERVVVMGCLSERYHNDLRKEIPEVDAYVGANKMDEVLRELGVDLKYELLGERILTTPKHFAYLKISEGCDNPCSFCAIPLMRGIHTSKPIDSLVSETTSLAAKGVRELILIGQDTSSYGIDLYRERSLAPLLRRLGIIDGIDWIRLMYLFPAKFPMDVLEEFAVNPKLCSYMDIPIQHIADPVLRSMRRGMSGRATRQLIDAIRTAVPGIALRTTLIVGYPDEGESEFDELLAFVKEGHFDRFGVFAYSQEDDTTAYRLGDPVPAEVKEERMRFIMEAQQSVSISRNQDLIGTDVEVMIDRVEGDSAIGRTEHDAPEIDNEVTITPANGLMPGSMCRVRVYDAEEYDLFAAPVDWGIPV